MNKFLNYLRLMRLHRPIGIFLLLWPTLWALWLAGHGHPDIKNITIFILGVVVMRSAGCVINDFADRNIDGLVARTRDRPLATRVVTTRAALGLFLILCLLALLLVLQLNLLTIELSVVALVLAIIYPFTKRYTHWPQIVLGAAFAWAVPMAFAAQTNTLPTTAWLLFLAALFWPVAYDTMYAMADREDDQKIGIKSTAILFGRYDRLWIGIFQLLVLALLSYVGLREHLGIIYFVALLLAASLAVYQQYLIKNRNPQNCFRAFLNNNWFGLVIFLGIFFAR
jgi:4-hydroxybenzoate polyprenyltransferase